MAQYGAARDAPGRSSARSVPAPTSPSGTQAQLRLQSAALNAAANAIVITDRAGLIEWVNPAFYS